MQTIDRFSYCAGTYLFWAENHSGQDSKGYEILSKISRKYQPSCGDRGWESLDEIARDVYRAWCKKESIPCEYDTLAYILADSFDSDDSCVDYFLDRYSNETLQDNSLCNYNQSNFVNLDMPYTRDLVEFYNRNETEVLAWVDLACDGYGYTSRLELLEGETIETPDIETPDDFAAGLVNAGMTYLGREMLRIMEEAV
jgi:hypothetical protein